MSAQGELAGGRPTSRGRYGGHRVCDAVGQSRVAALGAVVGDRSFDGLGLAVKVTVSRWASTVLLSLDPAWHRSLAVVSRVPLTGAAAAFAELLAASTATGPAPGGRSAAEPDTDRAVVQQGRHLG
ncbi:hypothetical protein [Streptomyces virginiae]|uniref:hypothetical protein n=1 Tax=Streptomyces virginiae TaxID=1961 RepID=UPI003F541DCB